MPHQPPAPRPAGRRLALRIGYDMQFDLAGPLPTAMLLMLYVHPDVAGQLDRPERLVVEQSGLDRAAVETFADGFGNRCARLVAPAGGLRVAYDAVFHGSYEPEPQ